MRFVIACAIAGALAAPAFADDSPVKEAGKHFQRGVALYNETDYRAALVEFKRAYETAPNSVVLYNIGETYYQLQNYAQALVTLERYLAESGDNATHRDEVEKTLDILRARVGKVEVTTNVPGAEVTVDDELVGKTPLAQPVLVSIGRRKVTAMHAGGPAETRFVEVAAGDVVKVALAFHEADKPTDTKPVIETPTEAPKKSRLVTYGWVATGALAVGGITMGVLAYKASNDLQDARKTFGVSFDDLNSKASRVTTFSAIADGLGAAAIIVGGITLTVTILHSRSSEVRVGVAPGRVLVGGAF
jgi:tetratricopeptide (TPR) repeat protein